MVENIMKTKCLKVMLTFRPEFFLSFEDSSQMSEFVDRSEKNLFKGQKKNKPEYFFFLQRKAILLWLQWRGIEFW